MPVEKDGQTTGVAQDGHNLRRRNVPDQNRSNGSITTRSQGVDEKKSRKVCTTTHLLEELQLKISKAQNSVLQILDEWEFLVAPLLFTLVSFFTRMYKIGLSNIVTWDEAQYVISRVIHEE